MGSRISASIFGVVAFALFAVSGGAFYTSTHPDVPSSKIQATSASPRPDGSATGSFSLITEPADGTAPVQQLIESASSSIDLVMYEFQDQQLQELLAERAKEGIAVRVILDDGYFGAGSGANEQAFDYLRSNGISVRWSPEYFALTHQKTVIVDGLKALIMTFNFSPQYYKADRDFGIVDEDQNDVTAIEAAFNSDWNEQNTQAQNGDDLVWSPDSRNQIISLISNAHTSLEIYNEEMQDPQIISVLERAAERGVNVEVDMTYSTNWKSAFQTLSGAGVHVRTYAATAPLYIHAKVVIADDSQAFVGSENFSSTSLDQNRELGLIISDPTVVASLSKTFAADWQNATPFLVQ